MFKIWEEFYLPLSILSSLILLFLVIMYKGEFTIKSNSFFFKGVFCKHMVSTFVQDPNDSFHAAVCKTCASLFVPADECVLRMV